VGRDVWNSFVCDMTYPHVTHSCVTCELGMWRRGHDGVAKSWNTCVRLENRIACIVLSVPLPDLQVPPPATTCCGPI